MASSTTMEAHADEKSPRMAIMRYTSLFVVAILCGSMWADDSEWTFQDHVQPLLGKYCAGCHNAEDMESGVRVDDLTQDVEERQLFLWKGMLKQLSEGAMPPEDELQPTKMERDRLVAWIRASLKESQSRDRTNHGTIRRLTVSQYRNTLRDLLGLEENLTDVLPPDGTSKEGFANHANTLLLSPLLVEAYFNIAEQALDLVVVDEEERPAIQNFRVELGDGLNRDPCPDDLILGAGSHLLDNDDFVVRELTPAKPFPVVPFRMRTEYEFNEGYQGNATVRGLRKYSSIYHSVFACMRGTQGYPKGLAYEPIPTGLLLRPAIPVSEIFGESSTLGPRANFKVSLRELPTHGNFRVTVRARAYQDGLLLDRNEPSVARSGSLELDAAHGVATGELDEEGIYQVDVVFDKSEKPELLRLLLDGRYFAGDLYPAKAPSQPAAFLRLRLPAGPLRIGIDYPSRELLKRFVLTRLDADSDMGRQFSRFEKRSPFVGVYAGLRRDCGSTLAPVGRRQAVHAGAWRSYVFEGAINDFPSPDVQPENDNYLAGIREIAVRSEYTDGRALPRLLVQSVEFEGPLHDSWPPASHRQIFIESLNREDPPSYAREIVESFASRAFRRPVTESELRSLMSVWERAFADGASFAQSVKDTLLVVLTSPQFLFIVETSQSPEPEDLQDYELASKLSYFLWNSPPDGQLLKLAAEGSLREALDTQLPRMIGDPKFDRFVSEFATQWLSLDKFDVVDIDRKLYPTLTRDTRKELRDEPIKTLQFMIQNNLPLRELVKSDFVVINDVVAKYYGLDKLTESGFDFVPVFHGRSDLGGLLSQASILAGLSDGREANPVKRGAWLARKVIAEPPDDPPPNVPELTDEDSSLTLREKLQRHRDQKGCYNCHAGIDPWGLPFEAYNAGGLFRDDTTVDARSTLPDETEVADLNELKAYLAGDRIDRVAFSFMSHLATYAVGRSLRFHETVFLEEEGVQLKSSDYRMQDMIRFVVDSDLFLKK